MGLFEKKEEEQPAKVEDNSNGSSGVSDLESPCCAGREQSAIVMMIKMYPDNREIQVSNIQNLSFDFAREMVEKVFNEYTQRSLAQRIVAELALATQAAKKGKNLWVPGSK